MDRVNNPKSKLGQLLCRHKHKGWYEKEEQETYRCISGERIYLICEDCGKIIDSYFARYEGMGFK
jgi:hypothetical protein